MLKILRDPAANAFSSKGGACPSLLTTRWDKGSCSAACWAEIKAATAAAGSADCCLTNYYHKIFEFTYGSSLPVTGKNWIASTGTECKIDELPCTGVQKVGLPACPVTKPRGRADRRLDQQFHLFS